ncbi:MAG TPA: right-handed parallel beta-helix repeat-containing protein [Methanothrix sp.]|nr:right-handed parallel beta-helix repeat-containing protein [Methanothrix sp.]
MKTEAFCLLCLFCIALLTILPVEGREISVSSNPQAAIDAASPGDTLIVGPGNYEKITISKSLNLIGRDATIRAGSRDACISVEADGVNISGFLVRDGFYGIKLNYAKGCTIANNTVLYCTQPGIALLFSDGNTITGNNASFNGIVGEGWYGIYLSNSNDNLIAGNSAYGNGAYGINLFPSCSNNTIIDNVLQGNMYGLYMFNGCSSNLIRNNDMSRNTNSGLDLRINCTNNRILNNTIENNRVAGITLMEGSHRNTISGNLIQDNGRYGLQIQSGSDTCSINYNNISGSQTGIFLESNGNRVYGNRITDNAVSADDRGDNTWNGPYPQGGNIWSDYSGSDDMQGAGQDAPGKDGIGDTPYRISDKAVDRYPIMGGQVKSISVLDSQLSPTKARVADGIAVKAKLKSRYDLQQVTVRAFKSGVQAPGYCRLVLSGQYYQGTFSTALLDPGKYDLVLSATDARGAEIEESLGRIEVSAR